MLDQSHDLGVESIAQLRARLHSLHDDCLSDLADGLEALNRGRPVSTAVPVPSPVAIAAADPVTRELIDLFNALLVEVRAAVGCYDEIRTRLRSLGALGYPAA